MLLPMWVLGLVENLPYFVAPKVELFLGFKIEIDVEVEVAPVIGSVFDFVVDILEDVFEAL